MLGCPVSHLFVHLLLELFNGRQHRINLHILDRILRYLTLENHSLFLVLFLDRDAFFFEVLDDHGDAVVRVLVHEDVEDPRLTILHASPVHCNLVIGGQTVVNFLQRGETSPRLQSSNIFDFRISFKHHQVVLGDYQVDVHHLLTHLSRFLAFLG